MAMMSVHRSTRSTRAAIEPVAAVRCRDPHVYIVGRTPSGRWIVYDAAGHAGRTYETRGRALCHARREAVRTAPSQIVFRLPEGTFTERVGCSLGISSRGGSSDESPRSQPFPDASRFVLATVPFVVAALAALATALVAWVGRDWPIFELSIVALVGSIVYPLLWPSRPRARKSADRRDGLSNRERADDDLEKGA